MPSAFGPLIISLLARGTTTLEVYASDNAGNISAANEIQFFVDSLSPDTTLASVECNANSLSTSGCLVATTTLNFKWSSSAPDLDFFVVNRNGAFSTTTATGTTVIAADSSAYTFAISARDIYGNAGATTTLSIEVFSAPVVINEIAWMGTDARRPTMSGLNYTIVPKKKLLFQIGFCTPKMACRISAFRRYFRRGDTISLNELTILQ